MPVGPARTPRITWPSALEARWQSLRRLEAVVTESLDRALQSEHGISASEYAALAALAYSDDGHLRQQVLASAIPLQQSSLSRLVDRLERAGLTERFHCPTDRRGVYTQITGRGRAVVAASQVTCATVLEDALARAASDPELTVLTGFLRAT